MRKVVYCEYCGNVQMEYDERGGYYLCPKCYSYGGFYKNDPEKFWFECVVVDDDEGEVNGIPYGCRSCGGDYPNCASSCNLMSD